MNPNAASLPLADDDLWSLVEGFVEGTATQDDRQRLERPLVLRARVTAVLRRLSRLARSTAVADARRSGASGSPLRELSLRRGHPWTGNGSFGRRWRRLARWRPRLQSLFTFAATAQS